MAFLECVAYCVLATQGRLLYNLNAFYCEETIACFGSDRLAVLLIAVSPEALNTHRLLKAKSLR